MIVIFIVTQLQMVYCVVVSRTYSCGLSGLEKLVINRLIIKNE